MVCRGLLLMLERGGQITLPAVRFVPRNPFVDRARPAPVLVDASPLAGCLREILPLEFWQVRRTGDEPFFNGLMEHHHYLGYEQPVGEHLKYLVIGAGRPVGCLALSSAPRHLGPRDHFIGWDQPTRKRNIHLLAYNTRFLILPWVRVPIWVRTYWVMAAAGVDGLAEDVRPSDLFAGNIRGPVAVPWNLL